MLLHGISEFILALISLEEGDTLLETPVVGKTCDSRMSVKRRPLTFVRVELVPVGFVYQHKSQDIVLML